MQGFPPREPLSTRPVFRSSTGLSVLRLGCLLASPPQSLVFAIFGRTTDMEGSLPLFQCDGANARGFHLLISTLLPQVAEEDAFDLY